MKIENVGLPSVKILSPEQKYCLELYDKTTCYDEKSGKVTAMYLMKKDIKELPSNCDAVACQFFYQEKKRQGHRNFGEPYKK